MELATSLVTYWSRCHVSISQWSPTRNIPPENLLKKKNYNNHKLSLPIAVFDYSGKIFLVFLNMPSFVYFLNVIWPIITEWHPKRLLLLVTWFLFSLLVGVWVWIHCIVWTHEINVSGDPNNLQELPPHIFLWLRPCQHTWTYCMLQNILPQ